MSRFAIEAMATRFEVLLPGGPPALGDVLLHEIDEWHDRLNRFAPDSWVAHVNRTAASHPVRCDEDVWALLTDAQAVWRASGGAFDVTRGFGHALVLDDAARTLAFTHPGMQLDFGGIAKGHALDCCGRLLSEHGVTSAFLQGGTSSGLAIGLDPATGQPWRVRLSLVEVDPTGPWDSGTLGPLDLWTFSVSDPTSQAAPHIVDPRSGEMITRKGVVMVTGPSARLCEAWSTAVAVLGVTTQVPQGYSVTIAT